MTKQRCADKVGQAKYDGAKHRGEKGQEVKLAQFLQGRKY